MFRKSRGTAASLFSGSLHTFKMQLNYKCLIQAAFAQIHQDIKYLADSTGYSGNNTYNVNLVWDPSFQNLQIQAYNFAITLNAHRDKVDIKRFFGTKTDRWMTYSYQMFIYSYYKSAFYGAYYSECSYNPENANVFMGHAVLSECLAKNSFSWFSSDSMFPLNILCTINYKGDRDKIFDDMEEKYPFLKNSMSRVAGSYYFFNPLFEGGLNALKYQCSSDKSSVVFESDDGFEESSMESENGRRTPPSRRRGARKSSNFVIEIESLRNENVLSSVTSDMFPLANSFNNTAGDRSYFIHNVTGQSLRWNCSMFIGRAVGMTSATVPVIEGNLMYTSVAKKAFDHLVAEELYSVTGIKTEVLQRADFDSLNRAYVGDFGYVAPSPS